MATAQETAFVTNLFAPSPPSQELVPTTGIARQARCAIKDNAGILVEFKDLVE